MGRRRATRLDRTAPFRLERRGLPGLGQPRRERRLGRQGILDPRSESVRRRRAVRRHIVRFQIRIGRASRVVVAGLGAGVRVGHLPPVAVSRDCVSAGVRLGGRRARHRTPPAILGASACRVAVASRRVDSLQCSDAIPRALSARGGRHRTGHRAHAFVFRRVAEPRAAVGRFHPGRGDDRLQHALGLGCSGESGGIGLGRLARVPRELPPRPRGDGTRLVPPARELDRTPTL